MSNYVLITNTNKVKFAELCNNIIKEGGTPLGGVSTVDTRNWGWMVATVKYSQAFLIKL